MQAFRNFAQSRLDELKDALIEASDPEDEEDEDEEPNGWHKLSLYGGANAERDSASAAGRPTSIPFESLVETSPHQLLAPPTTAAAALGVTEEHVGLVPQQLLVQGSVQLLQQPFIGSEVVMPVAINSLVKADGSIPNISSTSTSTAASTMSSAPSTRPLLHMEGDAAAVPLAVLQGDGAEKDSASQLLEACDETRQELAAALAVPGLLNALNAEFALRDGEPLVWDVSPAQTVPQLAVQCATALRILAPRALAAEGGSDSQRLLTSFSERYDTLLRQYNALQQRCREMSAEQDRESEVISQVEIWQSAHRAATARVEELSLENADLKERIKTLERRGSDPEETRRLRQQLAQRDAEVKSCADAIQRLQDVVEAGASAENKRTVQLERELQEARAQLLSIEQQRMAAASSMEAARQEAEEAIVKERASEARCRAVEQDALDTQRALEVLLQEKEQHLDERDNHVDRRVVTSMLALYLDHLGSSDHVLADQVLDQTLQVLGTERSAIVADRKRIKASAQRASGPLSDLFLDFLARETSDGAGAGPGDSGAASAAGA